MHEAAPSNESRGRAARGERRARALRKWGGLMLVVGVVVFLTRSWWRPRVGAEVLLAARGDFSRRHAALFRAATTEGGYGEATACFLDEVPGALDLWHTYLRVDPGVANVNNHDPATIRQAWINRSSGVAEIEILWGLDARDYDLAARQVRSNETEPPDLEVLLALDFDRARREALAHPRTREDLVTLVRWGVPRAEVEAAIDRLPAVPKGFGDAHPIKYADALRIRLILEDQTLPDPDAELSRQGLPVPGRSYRPPGAPFSSSVPTSRRVARFVPHQAMTRRNLSWALEAYGQDPRDAEARAFLGRSLRIPIAGYGLFTLEALVAGGDPEGIALVRADLASDLGAIVARALESCAGDAGVPLLASSTVRDHRWPWVRLRAVARLRKSGTPAARAALALYRDNACRDARLLAAGKAPYAVSMGVTRDLLTEIDHHASNVGSLD